MASVSGSQLAFFSPHGKPVNLIINDGKTTTGATAPGSLNIEIFTAGSGTALPGIAATATIGGAVKISSNEVQAGTLASTEQLGFGSFTVVDETGNENIKLGNGAQTVIGSSGDTIVGGNAVSGHQVIDLTGTNNLVDPGPMTVTGGAGALLIRAGADDSISGGTGPTTVTGGVQLSFDADVNNDEGDGKSHGEGHEKDHGHNGNDDGDQDHNHGHSVPGILANHDTIVGGAGALTVSGAADDSIIGGAGTLFVEDVTRSTIAAGTGAVTVIGGNKDVISDSVAGTLLVDIESQSRSTLAGSGSETVNLGAGHAGATLRDISVAGGTGAHASTTVTGFSTTMDTIASRTSVSPIGEFLGTSSVAGSDTILTFKDGSTMTLVGITDISKVMFTR